MRPKRELLHRARGRHLQILLAAAALLVVAGFVGASPVLADETRQEGSFVFQTQGDVDVPAGVHQDAVIVIDGDARIAGDVSTVLVVNGTASLTGATVGTLFVARGAAEILDGSVVDEVRTLDATYTAAPGTTVTDYGTVDPTLVAAAFVPFAIATWIGVMITFLIAGLVVAAVGGAQLRQAGAAMTGSPAQVIVAAIIAIIGLPMLAVLAAITVVGIPSALTLLFVVLPLVWFLGIVAVAARVGDWLLLRLRGSVEPSHPVLATTIGLIGVGVASIIPFLSFLIGVFGMGAITVVAWRAALSRRPTAPASSMPVSQPGPQPV